MVVVFLTLLQPEGENPLVGVTAVTAPRSGGAISGDTAGPPDDGRRNDGGSRGSGDNREGGKGADSSGEGGASAAGSTSVAAAPATAPARPATGGVRPSAENPDDGSPTDDQYSDTLARLAAGVN